MDPDVVVVLVLGGLGLAGRMRKSTSPAGRTARSTARRVVAPVQSGARYLLPVIGGPIAAVLGAAGAVVGESAGEVLDGAAATADWVRGRPRAGRA